MKHDPVTASGPGTDPRDAPLLTLLRISVLVLSSRVSGPVALRWVSYPIKVVVKSCKLLPTMALGSLLLRKRYTRADQMAAVLLCAGLIGCMCSGPSLAPALDVETAVRDAMAALPPAKFERVLHPVFEQDEATLIAVGMTLGGLVGLAQVPLY